MKDTQLLSSSSTPSGLKLRATTDLNDRQQVAQWLEAEHFLGAFQPVGHTLFQIITEADQPMAVLVWAASAYHLKDRDAWIGWDKLTGATRRNLIVNNVRFLVRQEARRPNLPSQVLGLALRQLPAHWQTHFGYEPLLAETFTDPELHAGTCYQAAGWQPLGFTAGHRRHRCDFYVPHQRPKRLWIKPLRPDAQARLCAPTLAPEHTAAQTAGAGARCALPAKALYSLAQALREVPDPRARDGLQYPLAPILTVIALGLMLGRVHLSEIVRDGQRLSPFQRQRIGFRQRRGTRFVPTPCYNVYRTVLARLDLDALAGVLTDWLSAHRGQLPATLACDGKTIRDRLGLIVTLLDVDEGVPVAVAAEPKGKGHEMTCARKLLPSVPLENVTVIADSLHTNAENAHAIVSQKGGDYIAALKDNQPTLHALAQQKLDGTPPLCPSAKRPTALSASAACGS
jgi:hypothetical protein